MPNPLSQIQEAVAGYAAIQINQSQVVYGDSLITFRDQDVLVEYYHNEIGSTSYVCDTFAQAVWFINA